MNKVKDAAGFYENLTQWKEECFLLREIILSTGLVETVKWGGPCYTFNGENVVGVAAFKSYVGLWFFQGGLLNDKVGLLVNAQENKTKAMRQWRFMNIEEIEKSPIRDYISESIENFRSGKKIKPEINKEIQIPEILNQAFSEDEDFFQKWESLSRGCKREFAEYIQQAKKVETQINRLEKIKPMILNSKCLNDKYK